MRSALPVISVKFRWRLAIAFLAVASTAAGVVAIGAYALVRADRLGSFQQRAEGTAELAASIIESSFGANGDVDVANVVSRLDLQGSFEALIVSEDVDASTSSDFNLDDLAPLTEGERNDNGDAVIDAEVDGRRGLLISPEEDVEGVQAYLFFSSEGIRSQMGQLGASLARAWLAVTLIAGALGMVLARRTLRPVRRASAAARSLAEGLLETRLPVDREDEFGAWAVSFNEMADELQRKIEALTEARDREVRFSSDVAHELRTPLTALVGSADLLRPYLDELEPEARWAAQHLLSEVVRLRSLVEELLEISRLDAGQESVLPVPVQTEHFLSSLLRRRGWSERVDLEGPGASLETDPRRLERVVSNLVDNALVHGRPPVTIRTEVRDSELEISVTDRGDGVADEHLQKVFDRFYKADAARSGGTGLGLAIARENAALLGGRLEASRAGSGVGTIFTLTLPHQHRYEAVTSE